MRRAASISLLALVAARALTAQTVEPVPAGVSRPVVSQNRIGPFTVNSELARRWAPLASAIVPGSGQLLIGEDRFIIYAAVEAGFWLKHMNDQADRRRQERRFRDMARDVARAPFAGSRPEGDWAYYEEMRKYLESGAFSTVQGKIVPPTDTVDSFNGFIWASALAHNPDSASALAEYRARAIPEDMRWSWRDARLQWDLFKRATEARNNAAGRAAFDLIVIGANHAISMVDAFTTVRLQVQPLPRPSGTGFLITGSVPVGR